MKITNSSISFYSWHYFLYSFLYQAWFLLLYAQVAQPYVEYSRRRWNLAGQVGMSEPEMMIPAMMIVSWIFFLVFGWFSVRALRGERSHYPIEVPYLYLAVWTGITTLVIQGYRTLDFNQTSFLLLSTYFMMAPLIIWGVMLFQRYAIAGSLVEDSQAQYGWVPIGESQATQDTFEVHRLPQKEDVSLSEKYLFVIRVYYLFVGFVISSILILGNIWELFQESSWVLYGLVTLLVVASSEGLDFQRVSNGAPETLAKISHSKLLLFLIGMIILTVAFVGVFFMEMIGVSIILLVVFQALSLLYSPYSRIVALEMYGNDLRG